MNAIRFKQPKLKKYAEKVGKYNLRMAIVDIGEEKEKEILLTNPDPEEFNTE